MSATTDTSHPSALRAVLPLVLPALVIGVACSLVLLAVSALAGALETFAWTTLPALVGLDPHSPLWTATVVGLTAVLIAPAVWLVPGHAGPDPATTSLVSPPLRPSVVPGLLVTVVLMLAGGISLGPENPIMAVTIALAVAAGPRILPSVGAGQWSALAVSGTIGALFGTPVAAALILSETQADRPGEGPRRPLWDTMVAPLLAAGAGALTTTVLAGPDLSLDVGPYAALRLVDLLTGTLVALVAAAVGLVAVYAFPLAHRLFALLRHQRLTLLVGGVLLAALAVVGGPLTMFKGLDQMKELASTYSDYSAWALLGLAGLRLVAVVVAGTSGFRGGRIFPSLFAGVTLGLAAHVAFPSIPLPVAVACGALGMMMPVTRQGWLSFFMAIVVVPDLRLVPLLCIAALPAWLLVSGRKEMIVPTDRAIPV